MSSEWWCLQRCWILKDEAWWCVFQQCLHCYKSLMEKIISLTSGYFEWDWRSSWNGLRIFLANWFEFSTQTLTLTLILASLSASLLSSPCPFSTLALIPCWEFGGSKINSNSLLDNYLWAYFFYLCLFFLAY